MDRPELPPELELLEMRLARRRRQRVIGAIALLVAIALVALTLLSSIVGTRRNLPSPSTTIEVIRV